jgi:hypothetical protein
MDSWVLARAENIRKGQRWATEIDAQLEATSFGIACITSQNTAAPWIHFEAGAIAKHAGQARVATLRVNVEQAAITGPLALFQSTNLSDPADFLKLLLSINEASAASVDKERVARAFDKFWPDLRGQVEQAIKEQGAQSSPPPPRPGSTEAMLQEILQINRDTHRLLSADVNQRQRSAAFRLYGSRPVRLRAATLSFTL